jgi:adenosylcobinamide-GDP ribazoletransferase
MIRFTIHQIKLFFTTLAFLSWIPIPPSWYTDRDLYRMGIYFPIVGAILGSLTAIVLYTSNLFFPYPVAIALSLLVYGLITGAFHEDAVADVADGMGGFDSKKIIEIMRDSRVGTYGSFALISTYVVRYAALSSLPIEIAITSLIAYPAVSRFCGVLFLTLTKPNDVPPESLSRTISFSNQWLSCIFSEIWLILIIIIVKPVNIIAIPVLLIIIPMAAIQYFRSRIGFITGDCAGFVIHCTETFLYVCATIKL